MQVGRGGVAVAAGEGEAALVVFAGLFGGGAEDGQVAESADVNLALLTEGLL